MFGFELVIRHGDVVQRHRAGVPYSGALNDGVSPHDIRSEIEFGGVAADRAVRPFVQRQRAGIRDVQPLNFDGVVVDRARGGGDEAVVVEPGIRDDRLHAVGQTDRPDIDIAVHGGVRADNVVRHFQPRQRQRPRIVIMGTRGDAEVEVAGGADIIFVFGDFGVFDVDAGVQRRYVVPVSHQHFDQSVHGFVKGQRVPRDVGIFDRNDVRPELIGVIRVVVYEIIVVQIRNVLIDEQPVMIQLRRERQVFARQIHRVFDVFIDGNVIQILPHVRRTAGHGNALQIAVVIIMFVPQIKHHQRIFIRIDRRNDNLRLSVTGEGCRRPLRFPNVTPAPYMHCSACTGTPSDKIPVVIVDGFTEIKHTVSQHVFIIGFSARPDMSYRVAFGRADQRAVIVHPAAVFDDTFTVGGSVHRPCEVAGDLQLVFSLRGRGRQRHERRGVQQRAFD